MNRLIYILFVLFLFRNSTAEGQDGYRPMQDIPVFKTALETLSDGIRSIESEFIQEKSLSILSQKIISRGTFLFMKEDKIRWEYTQPYQYLIILSNMRIFIEDESGTNEYDMRSNRMFQEMNNFITGCIQGEILMKETEYNIGYFENNAEYFVTLVPNSRVMAEMLSEVQIAFDRQNLTVNRINMVEPGGDYTQIEFINKKLNTEIPVENFNF